MTQGMVERGVEALSLLYNIGLMAWNGSNSACGDNCSGHGECYNGSCVCEIQFIGEECRLTNTSYFAAFATVFFLLAFVCLIQLVVCIVAEWQRLKAPTILKACRITTQKLLYFVVFLASLIRAAYFTSPTAFQEGWSRSLLSAYYPLLLSGSSLIVCFWAEIFHLRDLRWEHRQFLSKSFIAFVSFNAITYSLLVAEFLTTQFLPGTSDVEMSTIFNGCYAVLLLIVVIFFLIYGIEVFFKIRGGFLMDEGVPPRTEEACQLYDFNKGPPRLRATVDTSQLHQSRFGLLSQAFMLLFVVLFLCSETLGGLWKDKVPIHSRNWHNLVFRVFEIGVALWFPCVLWNSMSPQQLWILNPKRLLKQKTPKSEVRLVRSSEPDTSAADNLSTSEGDCWICYDTQRTDAGNLIQPCLCKGDVKMVHHDCLVKWLMERANKTKELKCAVCNSEYRISIQGKISGLGRALTPAYWVQTILMTCFICICGTSVFLAVQYVDSTVQKAVVVGFALLAIYVSVRCFCQRQMDAFQRAKVSALEIHNNLPTISDSCDTSVSSL